MTLHVRHMWDCTQSREERIKHGYIYFLKLLKKCFKKYCLQKCKEHTNIHKARRKLSGGGRGTPKHFQNSSSHLLSSHNRIKVETPLWATIFYTAFLKFSLDLSCTIFFSHYTEYYAYLFVYTWEKENKTALHNTHIWFSSFWAGTTTQDIYDEIRSSYFTATTLPHVVDVSDFVNVRLSRCPCGLKFPGEKKEFDGHLKSDTFIFRWFFKFYF